MYYFTFRVDNEVVFRTQLKSFRCSDITKKGVQCKRHCVIGSSYCRTHLAYNHHLTIKKSNIPNAGLGLFAFDPMRSDSREVLFKPGDKIASFSGEIIDRDELEERYDGHTAPYPVAISKNVFEDGAKYRGIGSLANTLVGRNNATFSVYRGKASLKCTKTIRNGDEIYVAYGKSYKINEPDVEFTTTKK